MNVLEDLDRQKSNRRIAPDMPVSPFRFAKSSYGDPMTALPVLTTGSFLPWPMLLAVLPVIGSSAVLWWFGTYGFYWSHFATPGPKVSIHLALRVLFAAALAWVVYSVGIAVVLLLCERSGLLSVSVVERYAVLS